MIDHVTYEVPKGSLEDDDVTAELDHFMGLIGLIRLDASNDILERGWVVRWYGSADENGPFNIHLVECLDRYVYWGLNHFCVKINRVAFEQLLLDGYVTHDSGRGDRIWLRGPLGIRVEVHPS